MGLIDILRGGKKEEPKYGDPYKPKEQKEKVWDNSCSTCGTGKSSIPSNTCPATPPEEEPKEEPKEHKCGCKCSCKERHADPSDFCPDDKRTILTGEISPYMYCKLQEGKDHRPYLTPKRCEDPEESHYKSYWDRHRKDSGSCGRCTAQKRKPSTCLPCRKSSCSDTEAEAASARSRAEYMEHTPLYVEEEYLRGFAVLSYLKPPVRAVAELYDRYPEGGEWGWFAFVTDKETFAYWNDRERCWRLISNFAPEQLLALKSARFHDGDTFVWDTKAGKFVVRQPAVYGIEMY